MYKFNGERRLQEKEGPTGLDLTGLVADIFMLWWDDQYLEKLAELGFTLDLYTRFKDDVNVISEDIQLGTSYINGKVVICDKKLRKNLSKQETTLSFLNTFFPE